MSGEKRIRASLLHFRLVIIFHYDHERLWRQTEGEEGWTNSGLMGEMYTLEPWRGR